MPGCGCVIRLRKMTRFARKGRHKGMPAIIQNEKRWFGRANQNRMLAGAMTAAFLGTFALTSYGLEPPTGKSVAGLPPTEVQALSERFVQEVWPMLAKNCL